MSDSAVQKYFRQNSSCLFQWTDHGRELCWLDGTTIAFHEELSVVLERLAMGNLPGFSSVVLSMAVLRTTWPELSSRLTRVVRALQNSQLPSYSAAMHKHVWLTETWETSMERLTLLTRFAQKNATTPAARAELLVTLFDRYESGFSAEEQELIASAFRAGLPSEWLIHRRGDGEPITLPSNDLQEEEWRCRPPIFHRVLHDVLELLRIARLLASGLHDYTSEQLERRLHTGVAESLRPPENVQLPPAVAVGRLLDQLREDPELSGFSRLTRHLTAAVTLPRSLEMSRDLSAGGVSDISNRGQLDKLLLSELAFDDLTLAIRIANHEAMYLRRETPPAPQAVCRPVLIDNSLPMWGIPRLYANAVALALQAGAEKTVTVNCFRPEGHTVRPVMMHDRQGLDQQLATMSVTEHPGTCLGAFEAAVSENGDATAEPVLITTDDILESHTFRRALSNMTTRNMWIISVQRDGRLSVLQRTALGTSVRKRIHLSLDEILSGRSSTVIRTQQNDDLPNILRLAKFPLLLSCQLRSGRTFLWDSAAVSVTDDGRLMFWASSELGAAELSNVLPRRIADRVFLVERTLLGMRLFLTGAQSELIAIDRLTMEVTRLTVRQPLQHVSDVCVCGTSLLIFGRTPELKTAVVACDLTSGRASEVISTEAWERRNGRCFVWKGSWYVLSFEVGIPAITEMPPEYQTASDVMEISNGEFIMVSEAGDIALPNDRQRFQKFNTVARRRNARLHDHLPGSDRVFVSAGTSSVMLNLATGESEQIAHDQSSMEQREFVAVGRLVQVRSPHWRFSRIGVDTAGQRLLLLSSDGRLVEIRLKNPGPAGVIEMTRLTPLGSNDKPDATTTIDSLTTTQVLLVYERYGIQPEVIDDNTTPEFITFEDCVGSPSSSIRLKVATWPDGRRAWLDSRGLLHVKNGDPLQPQTTITLKDGIISGWLSSAEVFGENYYCGLPSPNASAHRITWQQAWQNTLLPFIVGKIDLTYRR